MKTWGFLIPLGLLIHSTGAAATHTVTTSGFSFVPETLVVNVHDTIDFVMSPMHNAVEVSQATWEAKDTASNGGFNVQFGGGSIVLNDSGTHWYVCQVHVGAGMRGIIIVHLLPNTLRIDSKVDGDGSPQSPGDRIPKKWGLRLYKDTVSAATLVDSALSETTLVRNDLGAGTYIAVESDSASWNHLAVVADGETHVGSLTAWPVQMFSGEQHDVTFLNSSPHTIVNDGFSFVPESLLVGAGDTVHFVLENIHTAREVSPATWAANDTVSNGGFDLPYGGGSAVLTQPGVHYFVCVPHAPMGMKGRIIVAATIRRAVAGGWNMISLPLRVFDPRVTSAMPDGISRAFGYQGGYVPLSTLEVGFGYWLKFRQSETAAVSGFTISRDTVPVRSGWDMIGSISSSLAASSLTSDPAGIIRSALFGYDNGYVVADSILPGLGYWVKVSADGNLILDSSLAGAQSTLARFHGTLAAMSGRIIFRDAAGGAQTLYVADTQAETEMSAELPPPPPAGAFDVRFVPGDQMIVVDQPGSPLRDVRISGASYPMTIGWEIRSMRQPLSLFIGGGEHRLSSTGTIELSSDPGSLAVGPARGAVPGGRYSLEPAYPNPFNPSTVVEYSLAGESSVRISVYNLLGQEVARLKDGVQPQGTYSLRWNPDGGSSGIYYVRMTATPAIPGTQSYTKTEKVILQK